MLSGAAWPRRASLRWNVIHFPASLRPHTNAPRRAGLYHGVLKFSPDYPFKPPSIMMLTRNGRFKTNTRLCLSMSDFHPESWNPMWSVASILSGLLSFMLDTTPTLGSVDMTESQRRQLATLSLEENLRNAAFCKLFPEKVEEIHRRLEERGVQLARHLAVRAAAESSAALQGGGAAAPAHGGGANQAPAATTIVPAAVAGAGGGAGDMSCTKLIGLAVAVAALSSIFLL